MQQQPLSLLRTASEAKTTPGAQWERLYRYFVDAEEKQLTVTSVKIQQIWLTDTGELRDLDTIRWYMYHYWRWFLFRFDSRTKPYRYHCQHIKGYPLDYFVQAHTLPDRMQYLAHFVRSIEIDKALRKRTPGSRKPPRPRADESSMQQLSLDVDEEEIQVDENEVEEGPIQDETKEVATSVEQGGMNSPLDDEPQDTEKVEAPPTTTSSLETEHPVPQDGPTDDSEEGSTDVDGEAPPLIATSDVDKPLPPVETAASGAVPPRDTSSAGESPSSDGNTTASGSSVSSVGTAAPGEVPPPIWADNTDGTPPLPPKPTSHPISPLLIVGIIVAVCVVVAAAYFFFVKQPK